MKAALLKWVKQNHSTAIQMTMPLYESALQIQPGLHDEMKSVRGAFLDDESHGYLK